MTQAELPKVFITSRESVCDECGEELGRKAWITLAGDRGALCLACADLAVMAHIRHAETPYDQLLRRNWDRHEARASIAEEVRRIRAKWGRGKY